MAGPGETLGSPWPIGHPLPYAHEMSIQEYVIDKNERRKKP
jgi:hypothetical protein